MSWIDRLLGRTPPAPPAPTPRKWTPSARVMAGGRLSRDSDSTILAGYGSILEVPASPETDWRRLNLDANTLDKMAPADLSVMLADLSPDVSMALWNWLRLCNPGWSCTVTRAGTSDLYPAAQANIDAFLAGLHGPYVNQVPGANTVFGLALSSMFLRGSALLELVLDARGRQPLNIAVADPIYVRYKKVSDPLLGDGYELGQYQNRVWVPFDRPTIIAVPLDPLVTGPYGRPVAGSSLNTVIFLVAILNDLRRVIQQQGWPRTDLAVSLEKLMAAMPPESDEPAALNAWAQKALDEIIDVYNALEPDESYVHLDTTEVKHAPGAVSGSGLGALSGIIQDLERRVSRSLKFQPMFLGITDSSTESQARVQVAMQASSIRSVQHALEDAIERLLVLALRVQGIQAGVDFKFSELRALEADANAKTESLEIANYEAKVRLGWVTNDEAAMALTGHAAVWDEIVGVTEVFATESAEDTEDTEDDGDEPAGTSRAGWDEVIRSLRRLNAPATRVTIRPDGSDDGPLPLPDEVTISDADVEDMLDLWDELMPDYAGLLDADYLPEEEEERAAGIYRIGATPQRIGNVTYRAIAGLGVRRPLVEGENPWEYEAKSHRYRDKRTGKWLNNAKMIDLRDDFVSANHTWFEEHAARLTRGDINLQQWERQFREHLKSVHTGQYVLGRGGRGAMTPADWGRVGVEMRKQYEYLNGFTAEIATGGLSPATIASRSQLYVEASTASYERGRAASYRLVLPAYPGDGSTQCRVNCKCSWRITEGEDAWDCYWTLGQAEHCEDCVTRSQTWAPYSYPKR